MQMGLQIATLISPSKRNLVRVAPVTLFELLRQIGKHIIDGVSIFDHFPYSSNGIYNYQIKKIYTLSYYIWHCVCRNIRQTIFRNMWEAPLLDPATQHYNSTISTQTPFTWEWWSLKLHIFFIIMLFTRYLMMYYKSFYFGSALIHRVLSWLNSIERKLTTYRPKR